MDYNSIFDTDQKKARAFDEIAELYYKKNFGTASKSEIDLRMFCIFMKNAEETLGNRLTEAEKFAALTDHKIAKTLGITPSRVNSLKLKKRLSYDAGNEQDWKNYLRELIITQNAIKLENEDIVISISDRFIYNEISDLLEEKHQVANTSFNPKILSFSVSNFYRLCELCLTDEELEELNKNLEKALKSNNANNKDTLDKIQQGTEIAKNVVDIFSSIVEIINPATTVLHSLLKIFTK